MVFKKVAGILAEILGIDDEDITMNTKLNRQEGITALDVAKLIIGCEQTFGITIQDEEVHKFQRVGDLVAYIKKLREV